MAPKSKYMTGYKVTTDHRTIKRNERERNRVQNLNSSFEVLRQNIPGAAPMKKMSKIQILHQAVGYIQYLHQLIDSTGHSVKTEMTSPVMTGPVGQQYEAYPAYYQQYPAPLTPVSPGSYQSDSSGAALELPHWSCSTGAGLYFLAVILRGEGGGGGKTTYPQ